MKPSDVKELKAKKAIFLFPGFRGLTWKGTVYCKYKSDIQLINFSDSINSDFESHEMIHVRQAESTKNSWFCFYVLYLWYWIINLPLLITGLYMPYYFIPFELEAMANETNHDYSTHGAVYEWKEYKKFSFKEKYKLAKLYNETYKPKKKSVKQFIKEVVSKLIKEQ